MELPDTATQINDYQTGKLFLLKCLISESQIQLLSGVQ